MDSRFSDATIATPPRRFCPNLSIFFAALWSRCRLVPHSGQECQRTDKPFWTTSPQPLHRLRGIGGIDGDYPATSACCLVRQDDEERAPPRVTDGLRQMVMLHHVGRLEIFVIDHIIGAYEGERRLVVKVAPLASHRLVRFGEECDRLASTVAALLATTATRRWAVLSARSALRYQPG